MSIPLHRANFYAFLEKHRDRYVVVNFRAKGCAPCARAAPMFQKLGDTYAQDPRMLFGVYMLEGADGEFAFRELSITKVPRFDVYYQGERTFSVYAPSNVPLLKDYLRTLP